MDDRDELIRDLIAELRSVRSASEAVSLALGVLAGWLSAPAGVAWERDVAGGWRVARVQGDERVAAGALAAARLDGFDAADEGSLSVGGSLVLVNSRQGEQVAALWLADGRADGTARGDRGSLFALFSEVLGESIDRMTSEGRLEQAQNLARIGSWRWQVQTDEVWMCEQMYANLGAKPDRFVPTLAGYLERVHPEDREDLLEQVDAALAAGGSWHVVHRVIGDDGQIRWIENHGRVETDDHGQGVAIWGSGQDITERRQLEVALELRAGQDELTKLFNRWGFLARLERAMHEADGTAGAPVIALVDLDKFRQINQRFGWQAGDQLLTEVADRLRRAVPEARAIARLAADEFAVLLPEATHPGEPDRWAQHLAAALQEPQPLHVEGQQVGVRVGVAANHNGQRSSDELLRSAGVALQVAGVKTESRWQVFDPIKHREALKRLAVEADLRHAVEHGTIEVAYQPILEIQTGEISGVEALARWDRPGHGPISPAVFIPLAERVGLMGQLGQHVLEVACRQLADWQRSHPHTRSWHVAVNLSAVQLDDPTLVEQIEGTLDRCGLGHRSLVLEVTETALSHDTPGALARLFELRRLGVRVAIDDFGTGYSSLSRLRELPFDILKIDRAFIKDITSRHAPSPILQALFAITDSLGLDVVAEGVETPVQLAGLLGHECDYAQGYLFSRPLAPTAFGPLLTAAPPWNTNQIVAQVPEPPITPRLQEQLEKLTTAPHPSHDAVTELMAALAELTALDSMYLTRIDLRAGTQEIIAAANTGTIHIEVGQKVPWSQTLCCHAIADNRQIISEPRTDYPDVKLVEDLGVATYVGVEVHGPKGGLRGTLCGISGQRNPIPQHTVETMRWVARLSADLLMTPALAPAYDTPTETRAHQTG